MVINMTELPVMNWSPEQLEAARKLCTDGIIRGYEMPTILPSDPSIRVRFIAWNAADEIKWSDPEAIIIQGEPVFVNAFLERYGQRLQCYSPCYADGKFVQFRRF
jgi:hypothetical protein